MEISKMLICPKCFNNKGLIKRITEIRPKFPNEKCDFHPTLKGIPAGVVGRIIDPVFRNNFQLGQYNGMINDHMGTDLEGVLYDLAEADDHEVISALADELINGDSYWPSRGEGAFYSEDASYVRSFEALNRHSYLWDEFCKSIVHGQRFFNNRARELLDEIFDGIQLQRDSNRQRPVFIIRPGDPDSTVFRARIAEDDTMKKEITGNPSQHLGPPPLRKRKPGRMNPSGISAFYGAFDIETCISELRPSVGSNVIGAQFEITAPLCVLDTTKFDAPFTEPNLFSKDHFKRTAQWHFMQRFMQEISQPIFPNNEHLDYIPTQAVAEYLFHRHAFNLNGDKHNIEAIIFRSAQNPTGRNIVILGAASTVECKLVRQRSKLDEPFDSIFQSLPSLNMENEQARLRIIEKSVEIRLVSGATFSSEIGM